MPKKTWIDKKSAMHFTLVHRPQNDPLIHDDNAPSMVLNPTQAPNTSKTKRLGDLASELGSDALSIRDNEGEAANHGIYFDDTEYDYMQHLREIGTGGGEAVFVEANAGDSSKGKGKQKQSLEDALRELDLQNTSSHLLDEDILPSKNLQRITYQSQQDIPDVLRGFQPDMDPRLREVLEALEDDAYVDDEDDIFQELAKDGRELNNNEFGHAFPGDEEDDEGWESDDTAKPAKEYKGDNVPTLVRAAEDPEMGPSQDWMEDFKKFKKDQSGGDKKAIAPSNSELQSSILTTTTNGGRRKKRKGALTNPSAYSMTSSSLMRTEQLGILDARFDKIEEEYAQEDEDVASVSAISTASSVQGPTRSDFDGILDEFLNTHSRQGKKHIKKSRYQTGLEQLDEIRRGLGPARIRPSRT